MLKGFKGFKNIMFVLNSMIQDRIRNIALKVHPDYFLEQILKQKTWYILNVYYMKHVSNRVEKMKKLLNSQQICEL